METPTSPCHALGPEVFSKSAKAQVATQTKLTPPCLSRKGHCGARGPQSESRTSEWGRDQLLDRLGASLRGAGAPAWPDGLAVAPRSAASPCRWPRTGALPRQWRGAREAAGFCSPRKGAPVPATRPSLLNAAGQLPGPAPALSSRPAGSDRPTLSSASARETEITGCSWRPG